MNIKNKPTVIAFFLIELILPIGCLRAAPTLFISIDPSLVCANPGITQEINLINELGNTYIDKTKKAHNTSVSLGMGIRSYKNEQLQINTSLHYVPVSPMTIKGQIWQLKSPLFDDLAYSYQVKSNFLLVDNVISWTQHLWQPGVILGLGVSTNTTGKFYEIPLVDSAAPSLQAVNGSHTTQMAYELGLALDYSMNRSLIELAYRYINAGTGHLQPFSSQNPLGRLSTGLLEYHVLSIGIRAYYEL